MSKAQQAPDSATMDRVIQQGTFLLKTFHAAYQKENTGSETGFWRGELAGFRHTLDSIYGAGATQHVMAAVKQRVNLPIPHCGELAADGSGYLGFDSGCDM